MHDRHQRQNTQVKLANLPKEIHTPSGGVSQILAKLYKKILVELNMNDLTIWEGMMVRFITSPWSGIPDNRRDRSSARGNLQKELLTDSMSWKVFCKGLRFLQIKKFKIVIEAHHSSGKVTVHDYVVNLPRVPHPSDFTPEGESLSDLVRPNTSPPPYANTTHNLTRETPVPTPELFVPQGDIHGKPND